MSIYNELSLHLPCTIFTTINRFNDTNADDMQYGDLNEPQLKPLGLNDVSAKVDPYRLLKFNTAFVISGQVSNLDIHRRNLSGKTISHYECVDILFNEMKELSSMFAQRGEYTYLIREMIDHFRYGNGQPFHSSMLNKAFESLIQEPSGESMLATIKNTINKKKGSAIDLSSGLPLIMQIKKDMYNARLPKFSRVQDNYNGLAIAVHDIHAQEISLMHLKHTLRNWEATLSFKAQDHFGLDKTDITHHIYSKFRFFRIWFFLQRHHNFAFKPFFTNFNANIRIGRSL